MTAHDEHARAGQAVGTLVLGLGNDILTDDAVGLLVVREVARRLAAGQAGTGSPAGSSADARPSSPGRAAVAVGEAAVAVGEAVGSAAVEVREACVGGFGLIELVAGFARLIVVDAIRTAGGRVGAVYRFGLGELPPPERLRAAHEVDLRTALELGRLLGGAMPSQVTIVAVEIQEDRLVGEQPTPAVAAAVAHAVAAVLAEL